jgi:hypothetical protein
MTPKRPRDPNQLAKSIIDIATGQKPDRDPSHSVVEADHRRGATSSFPSAKEYPRTSSIIRKPVR